MEVSVHSKQFYFDIEKEHKMKGRREFINAGEIYSNHLCVFSSQFSLCVCISLQSHFYTHYLLIFDEFLLN